MNTVETQTKALLRAYSEHPVAYFPVYARIAGSVSAGVLLAQLLYWWQVQHEEEFYKTDEEFADELAMGVYELRGARKKLIEAGLITTVRKGLPRRMHYTVHEDRLIALITSVRKNPTLEEGKTQHRSEEKPNTPITDTTSDTTSERKDMQRPKAALRPSTDLSDQADQVIDYLNEKAGTRYRHSKASRKPILARIRDGGSVEDCRLIIDHKAGQWRYDPEMAEYLRPSTLFRPTHFEEYLASAIRWHERGRPKTDAEKRARSKALADLGRQSLHEALSRNSLPAKEEPQEYRPINDTEREIFSLMGGGDA